MKKLDRETALRNNTIAELKESMREAQRKDLIGKMFFVDATVRSAPPQIGVWKGGC